MKQQIILWLTAIFAFVSISACNTMQGIGEDIEAGGDAIEDSASKHKRY